MQDTLISRLIKFSQRHSLGIILLTAMISAIMGYFALKIEVNAQIFDLVPKDAEVMQLIERYSIGSSRYEYLVLAIEGDGVYSLETLQAFERAIKKIESLPHIIDGIIPFEFITFQKEGKKLKLVPMAPGRQAPRTETELTVFKQRLFQDPMARNFIVSSDLESLAVIFRVEIHDDYTLLIDQISPIVEDLNRYGRAYMASQIVFEHISRAYLIKDLPRLLAVACAVIVLVYFFGFRTRRAVLLPLITVCLGTIWTMGFMSLFDFKITLISIMTPTLVLTFGSSYSIHILNQYYRNARLGAENNTWIAGAVTQVNRTILMAALTTIIGFASLLVASIPSIREFGLATSLGIVFCTYLTLFFFPAVLYKLSNPTARQQHRVHHGVISRLMKKTAYFVVRFRVFILLALALIIITAVFTLRTTHYETDYINYFRNREQAVEDTLHMYQKFGGFIYINISISAPNGEKNYFLKQEALRTISLFEDKIRAMPDVVYISSFVSYLKMLNEMMYGRYDIPEKKGLILLLSRYFKAFLDSPTGKKIAAPLINEDFTQLTISVRVFDSENKSIILEEKFKHDIKLLEEEVRRSLDPETRPELWGVGNAAIYLTEALARSNISALIVSAILIFLVTALGFRSLRYGLYALIPIATGIMVNYILISIFSIPLDSVTIMVSSVVIGVGVDNSIHLLIQYRRQIEHCHGDRVKIISQTLAISGRPIFLTSMSLIAGLSAFLFSSFKPIIYFGLLLSTAIFTTTIGALVILPALLSWERTSGRRDR